MNINPTAGGSSSSAPPPPWIELPRDVTLNILRRLDPEEILDTAERVCTTWRRACGEPSLWRAFHVKYSAKLHSPDYADNVCRRAVDRSHGEMIDINIKQFGTDDLLQFISERSPNLSILSLESSDFSVSGKGLCAAAKNFPNLKELHLNFVPAIRALDIETIGVSCPMLNSFSFNNPYFKSPHGFIDNSCALSIAKSMPNLSCLQIIGNLLSNEGLLAILDCCPNLELLDLRQCFGVNLQGDLGRRCSEQIRELKRPLDSTEWDDDGIRFDSNLLIHLTTAPISTLLQMV